MSELGFNNTDSSARVTRRPLTRPQSARINRHIDALQYSAALRQIAADQETSLKQAEQNRERYWEAEKQTREGRYESRQPEIEAFRLRQQQLHEKKAKQYYSTDARRTTDLHLKQKETFDDHVEEKSSDRFVHMYHADIKKRQMRSSERDWVTMKQERSARVMSEAEQRRAQIVESLREQREQAQLKRAEHLESVSEAADTHKSDRHHAHVSKQIQRSQGRMMQLKVQKMTWQEARRDSKVLQAELIVKEKLRKEAAYMAEMRAALEQQTKRPRPRSAMTHRPSTGYGGISSWSDAPRTVATGNYDARGLGPVVSVVDARISVA